MTQAPALQQRLNGGGNGQPQPAPAQQGPSDFEKLMAQPISTGNVISTRELYGDLNRAWRLAKALARCCGLYQAMPKEMTEEEVIEVSMGRIIIGAELGIPPAASVRGIHFVKGRVALSADLMVAMSQEDGWKYKIVHSDPPGQWCTVAASKAGHDPYSFKWTMDMAQKAKLVRNDSGWTSYPHDMLYARAASHVARKVSPGRLLGIYTPEEARTIDLPDDSDRAASLSDRLKSPAAAVADASSESPRPAGISEEGEVIEVSTLSPTAAAEETAPADGNATAAKALTYSELSAGIAQLAPNSAGLESPDAVMLVVNGWIRNRFGGPGKAKVGTPTLWNDAPAADRVTLVEALKGKPATEWKA